MTDLLLPKHIAAARTKQRDEAAARSIQHSSINQLSSDDFVTLKEAQRQLDDLVQYVAERQAIEAEYRLPRPIGWRVSVLMLTIPETTDGGLHLVDEQREARTVASPQGIVLSLGDAAFKDPARFEIEGKMHPWIGVGDRVLWKKYDVTTFQLANGQRIGFMNDTQAFGLIDRGWDIPV